MRRSLPLLLILAACSNTEELMDEDMITIDCGFERVTIAADDATTLGATPGDLLAPHLGSFTLPGTWGTGDTTEVSVTLAAGTGDVSLSQATGPDAAMCPTSVSFPLDLTLSTADGLLDEHLSATWSADPAEPFDTMEASGWSSLSELVGTLDAEPYVDPGESYGTLEFKVAHDASGMSGAVWLEVSGDDGEVAWDGQVEVLAFGP